MRDDTKNGCVADYVTTAHLVKGKRTILVGYYTEVGKGCYQEPITGVIRDIERRQCDVTLPWEQNVSKTTMGSLSNDDGDGNENGKKSVRLY